MLSWTAAEHRHVPHSPDWYWGVALVAIVGTAWAVWFDDALFAVIIVICSALIFFFSLRTPPNVVVEISERGVRVGNDLFPYANLVSFSFDDGAPPQILFRTTGALTNTLTVLVANADPAEIREALAPFLKEAAWTPSLIYAIGEYFGF